jgi:hypothetical protein
VLSTLPPPANGTLYLIADTTLRGKTGQKQPLVHHTRLNPKLSKLAEFA